MPDQEARDALVAVDVELPNGKRIAGRLIPFRVGLALKQKLYKFSETIDQKDFDDLWAAFEGATGISEATLTALVPDITILELTDLISRFIYLLRPGRSAVQVPTATPASIEDLPPRPELTAESEGNSPSAPVLRRA